MDMIESMDFMELLTVKEFARQVKMSEKTIRRAITAGHIYAIRAGIGIKSPYRIPVREMERLFIKNKCEKDSEQI